jgi:hypothetical protein
METTMRKTLRILLAGAALFGAAGASFTFDAVQAPPAEARGNGGGDGSGGGGGPGGSGGGGGNSAYAVIDRMQTPPTRYPRQETIVETRDTCGLTRAVRCVR